MAELIKINSLVSIIVPIYNAEKYLSRCLMSITSQTYKKIEIILVNDGSTDKSEEICNRFALVDNRIKVISQKNMWISAARNTGIRQATGELLFFLDADDFIEKNTIEILMVNYQLTQPDLVMVNFSKLENSGEVIRQEAVFRLDDRPFKGEIKYLSRLDILYYVRHFLKYSTNHLAGYCWNKLYKLSIIRNNNITFDEETRRFEDVFFNLDYLKYANEIVFINRNLYNFTMNNNNISASTVILDSNIMLLAMEAFKAKVSKFLMLKVEAIDAEREIGQALTHSVIIFLIRSCWQINKNNRKMIRNEISKIINAPIFKDSLRYYSPLKGNSKILPWLMKLKLVDLIMFVCRRRAYKRYGKLVSA